MKKARYRRKQETHFSRDTYDILSDQNQERLKAEIPTEEPDEQLDLEDDLLIVDTIRKICKNNSQAKGWLLQIFLNVIGTGQKPIFKSSNEDWNKAAEAYYRRKSKKWEGRDNKNRFLCAEQILKTIFREGEILAFYDAAGLMNKGRWFYYTRDNITNIRTVDFHAHQTEIRSRLNLAEGDVLQQNKGIITNQYGITRGYIICSQPGETEAKYNPELGSKNKVTIIPAGRNTKLYKKTDEINAKHGLTEFIALAEDTNNVKRLTKAYIKKAEQQAKLIMAIYAKNPVKAQHGRSGNPEANKDRDPESARMTNIEKVAKEVNATIEYMHKDEKIELKGLLSGESKEVETIVNFITTNGGYGLGLARMFSSGSSDKASFAGLMAEANISAKLFSYLQKWVEREIYDFELDAVLLDGMETKEGQKKPELKYNDDWDLVTWSGWPKVQSLNMLQSAKAIKEMMRAGLMTPEEICPDMGANLKTLGELKKKAQEAGLSLDIFEETNPEQPEEETSPEDEDNNK